MLCPKPHPHHTVSIKGKLVKPNVAAQDFNPSIWEVEAGRTLCVLGQPVLHSVF